jgi:uncharacterized membrane protein YfcA
VGPGEALAILAAGIAAGGVNAVVGSGSLITFPTLLAFGFPPVVANVSNNVGLVPGNVSGGFGYRRELAGQRGRLIKLGLASAVGAVAGAVALLSLPSSAFRLIVPVLILISCGLVLVQPRLSAWLRTRRASQQEQQGRVSPLLSAGVCLSGVYGGYFGAAQGVLVIGLLGSFLDETLQRVNGAKNVLVGIVNGTAAVVFILFAHVSWVAVALIAVGSSVGALLGARFGRRLPPAVLRLFVVAVGLIAAVKLIFF